MKVVVIVIALMLIYVAFELEQRKRDQRLQWLCDRYDRYSRRHSKK